jgi:hypothetical protein
MKRVALRNSKRFLLALALITGLLVSIPVPEAEATNDVSAACVIGTDSACPAQSPQEIYNLYGTTSDGTYYLNVGGVSTQVYLLMNRTGSDNGSWVLLMKGVRGTSNFGYSSTYFTSNTSTLGTTSLSNDVTTDAKFSAYNSLNVKKILAVFKDPTYGSISSNGDITSNAFGGHVWLETLPSATTAFSTLDTARNIATGAYTNVRYPLYRESNSSSATQVFAYEDGYAYYGFKQNSCGGKEVRWGIGFNNESDFNSCDTYVGIGLGNHAPGDQVTWTGGGAYQNPVNTGKGSTGFQLWGKVSEPSLATPGALTVTSQGGGNVQISFAASSGATEYAVQYKTAGANWSTSTTVRLTNPGASPSATLTGLASGSYDFRVFARATNDSSAGNSSLLAQNIDATAPTVSSFSITSTSGADSIYGLGETITVSVGWSETVTVTGTPRVQIQGLSSKYLTYASGSGTRTTTFSYVVSTGDLDSDGISILANTLAINSGTIRDLNANDANLSHSAISATTAYKVDGVVPTLSTAVIAANGTRITLTFSETISSTISAYSAVTLNVGSVRNVLSGGTTADSRLSMDLTFAAISGSVATLSYTDPTSGNDTNALQDEAGNDLASFTNFSVTNSSTQTSNTSVDLSLNPASSTAVFRASTSLKANVTAAGKVSFFHNGKIISNCRNLATTATSPFYATCSWKPSIQQYVFLKATYKSTTDGFMDSSSSDLRIYVTRRGGLR